MSETLKTRPKTKSSSKSSSDYRSISNTAIPRVLVKILTCFTCCQVIQTSRYAKFNNEIANKMVKFPRIEDGWPNFDQVYTFKFNYFRY